MAGRWGAGTAYDPAAAQAPVLRWLTGSDWRPALRAVIAPTAVLLLAALLTALPSSYGDLYAAPFGTRFGAALAAALAALGAPFEVHMSMPIGSGGTGLSYEYLLRALPMTVAALWLLALWLGLRAGLTRWQARTGEQVTRPRAFGEAARTGLVAAAVTLLLGLLCGSDWQPPRGADDVPDLSGGFLAGFGFTVDAGWWEALGWSFLLAALTALVVYGTDAMRWAAWRNAGVRGWAVAALAAGRVLLVVVGVASAAAFVVVAAQGEDAPTLAALAFLPNLGLLLLGYGSGATFELGRDHGTASYLSAAEAGQRAQYSFFEMRDLTGDWRWAGLLALAAALLLGWTALRRGLDTADRLRLAVVHGAGLSLLMLLAGAGLTVTVPGLERFTASATGGAPVEHGSGGLTFATLLAANLIWAAAGALGVPPLLTALGVRAPLRGAVAGEGSGAPGQDGYAADLSASPTEASPSAAPPSPGPAAVVPATTDLLDSHDRSAPAVPPQGPARSAGGDDASVWRKQEPADG
ncbi:hypothetical protein [Kitasatospora sp. NBC_00315]|uniref:hypothetical protein n=1 Tax=Kitasatospora sp. NBC_00315 TaxID=2975963 RepID=UPI0032467B93